MLYVLFIASLLGTVAKWWGFLAGVSWWLIWTPALVGVGVFLLIICGVIGCAVAASN